MPLDPTVITLLETEGATLLYHPAKRLVHHQFRRFTHGDALRAVLDKGCEVMKARGGTKWLSDDRGNAPLKPADENWARTDWFPRVKAAGWKTWAVVLPEKALGQMNMKRWIELYASLGINADAFDDPERAMAWIDEQP